jgi:uncharacterized protein (UPF0332 family)
MKKAGFLSRLSEEGKLELVEPSEAVKESYLIKADNCLKSAKILLQNDLYENSMGEAYYAMYNCVTALLYKVGIKSENHSASIILLGKLFRAWDLKKIIFAGKEDREDKQYYVESSQKRKADRESCSKMILAAEDFMVKAKLLIGYIKTEEINRIRKDFEHMLGEAE